jgi:hypothetical protein
VLLVIGIAAAAGIAGVVFSEYFAPQPTRTVDEDVDTDAPVSKRGTFRGADDVHHVSGTVSVHAGEPAQLSFRNYQATSGPDVYFYLADDGEFEEANAVRIPVPGGVKDGQATLRGNFSLPLPSGVDLATRTRLVVWCQRFGVRFGEARLE